MNMAAKFQLTEDIAGLVFNLANEARPGDEDLETVLGYITDLSHALQQAAVGNWTWEQAEKTYTRIFQEASR